MGGEKALPGSEVEKRFAKKNLGATPNYEAETRVNWITGINVMTMFRIFAGTSRPQTLAFGRYNNNNNNARKSQAVQGSA